MIKGHTDIDIWNTGFFINADYFSDDFIIYNNTGKDLTRKTLAHPFFHNNSYKTTYTSFILCLSGTSEIEIDSINYSTKENTLLMMVPNQIIKYNEISEDYKAHLIMISNKYFDTRDNFYKMMSLLIPLKNHPCIIRKSKFPQNPKRSVRFSGKGTKRSVQKRKARNTQKAETKVL